MFYTMIAVILLIFFLIVILKRYKPVDIFLKTFWRDTIFFKRFVCSIIPIVRGIRREDTVAKIFQRLVVKHPNKVAFYYKDEFYTFQDIDSLSNKIGQFFKKEGYKRGDCVALLLEGSPEYVCIWLGLAKIGVITALINHNIAGDPLVHSIQTTEPKAFIYGSGFKNVVRNISGSISNLKCYELSTKDNNWDFIDFFAINLRQEIDVQPDTSLDEDIAKGKAQDRLLYIYTSGTTGLPKAVTVKNMKYFMVNAALPNLCLFKYDDIMYNCLPLYHTMGGVLGTGHCLINGGSVALRKQFSATNFWKDCNKYNCTIVLYIGEFCRYILAQHINDEKSVVHPVKKFVGGGLKPAIWQQFVSKFKIEGVYEMYGSTEGNTNIINLNDKPGAVGYLPFWAKPIYPLTIVKCDLETAEPIRGSDGFCQKCEIGESGLMIATTSLTSTMIEFAGYTDKKATEQKLLKDVFQRGDVYFNSGDILAIDELRYLYFKDRIGDTFRWKGENVSTVEVEAVMSNILDLNDAVVYGVEVPNTDGKAGMAAIVSDIKSLDMRKFCQKLKENLPSYAIPLFMRIVQDISLTATFKIKKRQLREEGFNVEKIKDKVFLYDAKNVTYIEITKKMYKDIVDGIIRL